MGILVSHYSRWNPIGMEMDMAQLRYGKREREYLHRNVGKWEWTTD